MSLKEERKDYTKGSLDTKNLELNPLKLLKKWLEEAKEKAYSDYNAMVLSTINPEGFPASRVVLLRELDLNGLVFYTNYNSDKGKELELNPKATCNFFWRETEKQVRVSGLVKKTSKEVSNTYFSSRPRTSQIGAWASEQSSEISSRKELEKRVEYFTSKFEGADVPRPSHWGGYVLEPIEIEFWQGRASRLHDRIVYTGKSAEWKWTRKSP